MSTSEQTVSLINQDELGQKVQDVIHQQTVVPSIKDWILHRHGNRDLNEPIKMPLDRETGLDPQLYQVTVIYECKDDCKTILDSDHTREIERFSAYALDDELWGMMCRAHTMYSSDFPPMDGQGCTE